MKVRTCEAVLERCGCGRQPGINILQAGPVRLHKVSCVCGAETATCEEAGEAVDAWNAGELRTEVVTP